MSYEDSARIISDDIFELVNECFRQEKSTGNMEGRVNFFDTFNEYFVLTDDGSYSINSKEINHKVETLHTSTGAISESFEKFIRPMKFDYSSDIAILDICAGLGYNSSAAIADFMKNSKAKLTIDMVEISKATFACGLLVPSPIPEHDITKRAIEDELVRQGYATLHLEKREIPSNIDINVYIEDARKTVQRLPDNTYDAIFLDPFSQNMAPELFSVEFFNEFRRVIKDDGIVATYTSSSGEVFTIQLCKEKEYVVESASEDYNAYDNKDWPTTAFDDMFYLKEQEIQLLDKNGTVLAMADKNSYVLYDTCTDKQAAKAAIGLFFAVRSCFEAHEQYITQDYGWSIKKGNKK